MDQVEKDDLKRAEQESLKEIAIYNKKKKEYEDACLKIFDLVDLEGLGSVDRSAFESVLKYFKLQFDAYYVNLLFKLLDTDEDEKVDYHEFGKFVLEPHLYVKELKDELLIGICETVRSAVVHHIEKENAKVDSMMKDLQLATGDILFPSLMAMKLGQSAPEEENSSDSDSSSSSDSSESDGEEEHAKRPVAKPRPQAPRRLSQKRGSASRIPQADSLQDIPAPSLKVAGGDPFIDIDGETLDQYINNRDVSRDCSEEKEMEVDSSAIVDGSTTPQKSGFPLLVDGDAPADSAGPAGRERPAEAVALAAPAPLAASASPAPLAHNQNRKRDQSNRLGVPPGDSPSSHQRMSTAEMMEIAIQESLEEQAIRESILMSKRDTLHRRMSSQQQIHFAIACSLRADKNEPKGVEGTVGLMVEVRFPWEDGDAKEWRLGFVKDVVHDEIGEILNIALEHEDGDAFIPNNKKHVRNFIPRDDATNPRNLQDLDRAWSEDRNVYGQAYISGDEPLPQHFIDPASAAAQRTSRSRSLGASPSKEKCIIS